MFDVPRASIAFFSSGNSFTRNWVVNEKENPTTGTPYAWVRSRYVESASFDGIHVWLRLKGAD